MSAAPIASAFNCTQCGGELNPDQGQVFLTCPFCSSTVYLDKKQAVFHHYLAPTLDEAAAVAYLRAWMSGNDTLKDLDKKSAISEIRFEYFPVWFFRVKTEKGAEKLLIEPAAATAVLEIKTVSIPAGDLRRFDSRMVSDVVEPTVPLEAARKWLAQEQPETVEVLESALVHLPFFTIDYTYGRRVYTAVVEAGTGQVLATIFPVKKEAPYQAISLISIGGYLLLAMLPACSAILAEDAYIGFMKGVGQYFIYGAIFFVICMVMAIIVAKKA